MLRTALAMLMIGSIAAWGQTQNDTSSSVGANKVDRATAYYHFTLAHMYSEMAASSRNRNSEYQDQADENYKAAIKADPRLSEIHMNGPTRFVPPIYRAPAPRQDRSRP